MEFRQSSTFSQKPQTKRNMRKFIIYHKLINVLNLAFNSYEQTIDALLLTVSKRIASSEQESKMVELLNKLSDTIKPTTGEAIVKTININKSWQSSSEVQVINDFIINYMNTVSESEHNWRLPKTSAPISYELKLVSHIDSTSTAVEGEVLIKLRIMESTDRLTLHSRTLNINDLRLFQADGVTEVMIINYSLYAPTDMLTIYLVDYIASGTEFVLSVKYNFDMNTSPSQTGFYRTSYLNTDGLRRFVMILLLKLEFSNNF